jgi:hypothetical protein
MQSYQCGTSPTYTLTLINTIEVLIYYYSNFSNIITIIDMIISCDELIINSYDYIITNNIYLYIYIYIYNMT